jgi:ubiquinone biosynthesis protein UbiJ
MPETKKETDASTIARLAERGEETLKRLSEELDKNPRMHDAKDRVEKLGRSLMHQLNVAVADEVEELKKEIARLEKRLAKVEKEVAARPPGQ